jgi:hypothetical protein
MIELFEKFKAARVKGACIIPEVFNNVLEIWVLSPTVQETKRTPSMVDPVCSWTWLYRQGLDEMF